MIHARQDYNRIQDPLNKIPADEPVFMVRAQDKNAASTARYWAELNDLDDGDPRLSALARKHADLMDAWPVKKIPDLPRMSNDPVD